MSEAKVEGKKKGKLPVIIAIVAVLGGGGFFMMKGKADPKKEPEVKFGKIVELEEKLVNLTDVTTFLRSSIALHLKEGFDETKMKEVMPAVDDVVVTTLKSLSPNDVRSAKKIVWLRRELASKINHVLETVVPDPKKEAHKEPDAEAKGEKEEKKPEEEKKPSGPKHPDWDSDTGPVLKVYFKAFAIQ